MPGSAGLGSAAGPVPAAAMVLAAGLGERMRPITAKRPKPLIEIRCRTLLDRAIDRLEDAGVTTVVVNLHHLGYMIEGHLESRPSPAFVLSREEELLDTGGGVRKALPLLGGDPFLVVNGDVLWLNGPTCALTRLARTWDAETMDALLMLHSTVEAYGYRGLGDFCADPSGLLSRRPESEVAPFLFTGIQMLHPRLFDATPEGPFSLNVLYDRAMDEGRLYGIVHDGEWFHIDTPDALAEAEDYMKVRFAGTRHR